jgi:hypothetical protein
MKNAIRQVVIDFCIDFVENPYLCYTEHGQHALFFARLYNAMPEERRYTSWKGEKVCVIQKEYPTADKLGRPKRQHWDIAVIKSPPRSIIEGAGSFDYLSLDAVVEFGMNEDLDHLVDDIDRISHPRSNVDYGFLVHLHRLSTPGTSLSGRDWSAKSKRIVSPVELAELINGKALEIYYGLRDITGTHESGLWLIDGSESIKQLANV